MQQKKKKKQIHQHLAQQIRSEDLIMRICILSGLKFRTRSVTGHFTQPFDLLMPIFMSFGKV